MNWYNIKKRLIDYFIKLILIAGLFILMVSIVYTCCRDKENTTSPVENNRIDSITKENDKLIIEVEHLDSIKDAKIIKVKSLDNDSTLRLFYQLIGK